MYSCFVRLGDPCVVGLTHKGQHALYSCFHPAPILHPWSQERDQLALHSCFHPFPVLCPWLHRKWPLCFTYTAVLYSPWLSTSLISKKMANKKLCTVVLYSSGLPTSLISKKMANNKLYTVVLYSSRLPTSLISKKIPNNKLCTVVLFSTKLRKSLVSNKMANNKLCTVILYSTKLRKFLVSKKMANNKLCTVVLYGSGLAFDLTKKCLSFSGNCQETETLNVRACHTPRQRLQNHPSGHLGGWATLWKAEKMLDGQHPKVEIHTHARIAHNGLPRKRLEENRGWIVPHVSPMTQSVKGLNRTDSCVKISQ